MRRITNSVFPHYISGLHGGSTGQAGFAPATIHLAPKSIPPPPF